MHFWIDKRSSNLHNYGGAGRGRPPGSGGFYSRTFGTRHHPPPLLRSMSANSSNSSPSSSSSSSMSQQQLLAAQPTTTYMNIRHNNIPSSQQSSQQVINQTNLPSRPELPNNKHFQIPINRLRFQGSQSQQNSQQSAGGGGSGSSNNIMNQGSGGPSLNRSHHAVAINMEDSAAAALMGQNMNTSSDNYYLRMYFGSSPAPGQMLDQSDLRTTNAFRNLNGVNRGLVGPPGRRPRSQSHSITTAASNAPGRRRSSSGSTNSSNQRRTSMNRWTYDPYHLHQQSRSQHSQQVWNDGIGENPNQSIGSPYTTPVNLSDLTQNGEAPSPEVTSSTSSHSPSVVDPAWKRTKRIGLTLCFMSFILLSTVAAKFIIEGPLLIDKTPRSERTEATIYFFLTELIFVVFAMALFFTGVTCLRKRTNAYLLRQFNQYIMQSSSPHAAGTMGSPEYFHRHNNHQNSTSSHSSTGMIGMSPVHNNMINNPQATDRPFSHYLPSLENHLMNMHITVAESHNFGMGGSKPPPYHIALYLPVPNEPTSAEHGHTNQIKDTDKYGHHPYENQHQSSSWISSSSCLTDGNNDNDKTEDESDEEIEGGVPRRKRQKTNEERPETPPPPYGQL